MSRTNISPPQMYSSSGFGVFTASQQSGPSVPWSTPSVSTIARSYNTGQRSRLSQVTPGFQNASDSGQLLENAFTYLETFDSHCLGIDNFETRNYVKIRNRNEGVLADASMYVPVPVEVSSLLQLNLDNKVKQKILERVKDSDVNLGVIWGEREQTFRLLADATKRLGQGYHLARSGDFLGAAKALVGSSGAAKATIARNWLELQYGWRPLVSDIYGLCKTAHKLSRHRQFTVVSYRSKINDVRTSYQPFGTDYTVYKDEQSLYESSGRVKFQSSSMLLATAAELGLINPAVVAWELVPFSFVVDWAVPIGSFLSQFDAAAGWQFMQGSLTHYSKAESVFTKLALPLPVKYVFHECNVRRTVSLVRVTRGAIGSWSSLLSLPYVKNPASLEHVLNALALLTSKR